VALIDFEIGQSCGTVTIALAPGLCHHSAMIAFTQLDLMARGGTLALIALWSWLLFRDHRQALAAKLALAMNAAIVCHVIASVPGPFGPISAIDIALDAGSSAVFASFWLFTRAWFEDEPRFGWRTWAIAATPSLIVAVVDIFRLDQIPETSPFWFPLLRGLWFALGISGLWIAWRGRADDLVEQRRVLRLRLAAAIGGLAIIVNIVEIAVFIFGAPISWRSGTQFGIVLVTGLLCASMFSARQADLFGQVRKPEEDLATPLIDDPLAARLRAHMASELPHRDEGMTIAKLAAQLGEQEYRLRRLINGQLGYRNFATFLNGYRLAEVRSALGDQTQKDVSILTIALDAGFGSLGPFNRAFRDAEGMTPSTYRAQAG
jgi:AraC-like DNA-binding protein